MAFPKQIAVYTSSFINVGQPNEALKLVWNHPIGNSGTREYTVGTDCFLESPTLMSQVNEEHLISSLSMAAILAGEILPGTTEYIDAVTGQGTKYFQTIIGNVTIKSVVLVEDLEVGPDGTVYDVTFNKVGASTNTKVVRIDAWSISQYSNRVDSPAHSIGVVPGAVHKQFGLKKSELGADDSENRLAIIAWIDSQRFWI